MKKYTNRIKLMPKFTKMYEFSHDFNIYKL